MSYAKMEENCKHESSVKRDRNKLKISRPIISRHGESLGLIIADSSTENAYRCIVDDNLLSKYYTVPNLVKIFNVFDPVQRYLFEVYADIYSEGRNECLLCLICGKILGLHFDPAESIITNHLITHFTDEFKKNAVKSYESFNTIHFNFRIYLRDIFGDFPRSNSVDSVKRQYENVVAYRTLNQYSCGFCAVSYAVAPSSEVILSHLQKCEGIRNVEKFADYTY